MKQELFNKTTGLSVVPSINEENDKGRFTYDVFSRVLKDRIIYVTGEFNQQMFELIHSQLVYLDAIEEKDITMIINSPGGEAYALLGIIDTMESLKSKVNVICYGMAASCAAILFIRATGKRVIGRNSRLMIHSVSSGTQGKLASMEEEVAESKYLNDLVFKLMAEASSEEVINKYKDKKYSDCWINAEQAVKEGLADEILESKSKKERK
jgi:ATP-dependent Clp protease protease subunit